MLEAFWSTNEAQQLDIADLARTIPDIIFACVKFGECYFICEASDSIQHEIKIQIFMTDKRLRRGSLRHFMTVIT